MNVSNREVIRRLSWKSVKASGRRNVIAIGAIALTTILFTALFTILLSVIASNEQYTMRELGGYAQGTFKEVTKEQEDAIRRSRWIKAAGERTMIGFCEDGEFGKVPAEVSYMDANMEKWSYITYAEGGTPQHMYEIAMDDKALALLGVKPKVGEKVKLTYLVEDKTHEPCERTDEFVLSGWWKYDELCPVHFMNVSSAYVQQLQNDEQNRGADFRTDLNVMFRSSFGIERKMSRIVSDIGCQSDNADQEDYLRYGVNSGYVTAGAEATMDGQMVAAMIAFLLLVIFTGYLIIYNIFQISVSSDIRYYGLLKTIGVTPGQLKRMIRWQACILCCAGCPVGLLVGYGIGTLLVPKVVSMASIQMKDQMSTSPFIFLMATMFSVSTVFLSCGKPARMAAGVSPVEAMKYTEVGIGEKKKRTTRGAKIYQMAFANLGRNKVKTALAVSSLVLSVVLFSVVISFTSGFDMEKYLKTQTCSDFVVGTTDYFRYNANNGRGNLSADLVNDIRHNTTASLAGQGYGIATWPVEWLTQERIQSWNAGEQLEEQMYWSTDEEKHPDMYGSDMLVEGLDPELFSKLTVIDGNLSALEDNSQHAIAIVVETDDYGNVENPEHYLKVGDSIQLSYIDEAYYIDNRTGLKSDDTTPYEYLEYHIEKSHEIEYTVAAQVSVPYAISLRYSMLFADKGILSAKQLQADSGQDLISLFYTFDTPDAKTEAEAENYLAGITDNDVSEVTYESKAKIRTEFQNFKNIFIMLGVVLCIIIGLVGVLNYFNSILTGILSRSHEFAILQSIGMTGKQLRQMLICEGLFYTVGTILLSLVLNVLLCPLMGKMMEQMFYFYRYHFTLLGVLITAPAFLLIGTMLPVVVYWKVGRLTIVERLRSVE